MKFLIENDPNYQEELDCIANGLGNCGHEIYGFGADIFRANEERDPNHFIFTQNTFAKPETQKFIKKTKKSHLIVNSEQIFFSGGNFINLPSFANTIKYRPELPVSDLECDIGICFDGRTPELVHTIYHRLYQIYKIKVAGAFINCAGFIGICQPADIVRLGKSSQLMVCTNKVIANSLIWNNIYASYGHPYPEQLLNNSIDDRENMILESKKSIITETALGKIICEKLSNSNR
jgi:hypothetical protein